MSNISKIASVVLVLLLSFAALPGLVKAQTPAFSMVVEVDGDLVSSTDVISVERGDTVEVEVRFKTSQAAERVELKAEIKGLEGEDIEDEIDFDALKIGTTYVKTLQLEIPEDIGEDDLDQDLTLRITADGRLLDADGDVVGTEKIEVETGLVITSQRHDLRIQDIVFRSGKTAESGGNLFLTVWVENKGSKDEEGISVQVSVPQLGLSARDVIDELVTAAHEDDANRDRDTDTSSVNFALKIPASAESGDYDVVVEVEYDRGRSVVKSTESFTVEGVKTSMEGKAESIVTVDTTSQSLDQGEGAIYKFSFANLGKLAKTFSIAVTGVESFGTARVDPSSITVQPGATSEVFVFVTAKDDASLGKHLLTARVMEGSTVLRDVSLEADVKGQATPTAITGAASVDQVRKGLEIGFAVLLIILVILGIIIAIGKLRKGNGMNEEEPGQGEGQSYYYYPRY